MAVILIMALKVQAQNQQLPLIPYPQEITVGQGKFNINAQTVISLGSSKKYIQEAGLLNDLIANSLGQPLKFSDNAKNNVIKISYNASLPGDESYTLNITPQNIILSAKTGAGIIHGIESIRQLLPVSIENKLQSKVKQLAVQAVNIKDEPKYAYRGMHLDVSRHFFSISYLKKYIDLLALYKFNKLHLHLTDDQGWRIEIKKYPKLTERGAWRTFNNQDSACMENAKTNPDFNIDPAHIVVRDGKTFYGGFYTQQDMKGIVAYAAKRHIDVIPEVDMPGHMMAAINNYPFLSCEGGSKWGELFTTPICPCNENVFAFAEDVYKEIFEIFPSKYIHIGGDEVDRTSWGQSAECKALMAKEGLKTVEELQSYFIHRMEKFFNKNGRKLIGWDEILEGGISPTAMIMYWRGWKPEAPVLAAKNGNTVIMTPGEPLYFDYQPDKNSIYNVYHFNPIPAKLTTAEGKSIVGAQANVWSEKIPTENRADYMVFPRMTALAEVLWTGKKDYDGYLNRLTQNYPRLDALKVRYRLPDLINVTENNVFTDEATLNISKPLPKMVLRYTVDGSIPNENSTEYTGTMKIAEPKKIKIAGFMPNGNHGDVYNINYVKQTFATPVSVNNLKAGLIGDYYAGFFKRTTLIPQEKPTEKFIVNNVLVPAKANAPSFGIRYKGYLNVPEKAIYTFYFTCDDGGVLKIANRLVVDNDGHHSAIEKDGQIALDKGLHPFAIDFVEGGGGFKLLLKYSVNGSAPQDVPADWLKHKAD